MSTSQEAKLQFRYELTGNGIQAVNKLTGEVLKLATAEETAIGNAKKLGQELGKAGSNGPPSGGFGRGPFTGGGGNVDRSVMAAPRPGFRDDNRRGGESELVRAISRLVDELHRLPESLRGMVASGPQMGMGFGGMGVPGIGQHKPGSISAIESGQEGEEFREKLAAKRAGDQASKQAQMVSFATLGAGAARLTQALLDSTGPYKSEHSQTQDFLRGYYPGYALLRDTQRRFQIFGKGLDQENQNQKLMIEEHRDAMYTRPFEDFKFSRDLSRAEADNRMLATKGYDPTNPYGPRSLAFTPLGQTARGTVSESRAYAESQKLLPSRDALIASQQEQAVARKRIKDLDQLEKYHTEEMEKAKKYAKDFETAARRAETDEDAGFKSQEYYAKSKAQAEKAKTHAGYLIRLDDERQRSLAGLAEATGGVRAGERGVLSEQLGIYRERESTARSQSQRLGMLGVSGNAMADQAMQIIQQTGDISLLPPEIIAQAQAKYPELTAKLLEQSGQQYLPGAKQFSDEYRDSVPDISAKVDEAQQQLRDREQNDLPKKFLELYDTFSKIMSRENRLMVEFDAAIKQIEADLRLINNQPK